ncbi:unnamed protein product [Polarella glacialis]|uniref:Uncharacterized protein n=1 Tax=Polarella glacialis TaxID=89957 RepID=A0A813GEE4_POLGL|nr:unnamed protein product [Polarella glacialis]
MPSRRLPVATVCYALLLLLLLPPLPGCWVSVQKRPENFEVVVPRSNLVARRCAASGGAEALQARYAGLVGPPACAIISSPRVRAAASVLAKLAAADQLRPLALRAVELLQLGKLQLGRGLNWPELQELWPVEDARDSDGRESRDALAAFARLLTIGTNEAIAFSIQSGSQLPGQVLGTCLGQQGLALRISDAGHPWGPMARLRVADGPQSLRGLHVVAWERFGPGGDVSYRGRAELLGGDGLGSSAYEARVGDTLYLAEPDRAAFLEIATFDRLPLSAALLSAQDLLDLDVPLADMGEELREAQEFASAHRGLPPSELLAAQLARLAGFSLVRQVLLLAKGDPDWLQVLPVLSPLAAQAYSAAESQLTGFWVAPWRLGPDSGAGLQVLGVTALLAGVVLVLAAAWGSGSL